MVLEKNIVFGNDREKTYFINGNTGVKLVLKVEGDKAWLIEEKICEADIERAFLEDVLDISQCRKMKPSESEVNIFKIFIQEYIKGKKLIEFQNLKIIK